MLTAATAAALAPPVTLAASAPPAAQTLALARDAHVIVNADQAGVSLSRDLLWAIFTMHVRQWPGGEPIRVFVLPDDAALSTEFYRSQLGTYPYVLRSLWDRMVFTGTGLAPTVVSSEREMRARIRATPGAIGYADGGVGRLRPRIELQLARQAPAYTAPPF